MQLKEVAELLGVDKKEVIEEIEAQREQFAAKGFKLAKKLSATSALDRDLASLVVANFDIRRQERDQAEQKAQDRRHKEEEDRRRAAEELDRKRKEEEAGREREARRLKADEELKRKQAMQAAAAPVAAPAPPKAPVVAPAPVAAAPAPAPVEKPVVAAPAAPPAPPVVEAPAPAPVQVPVPAPVVAAPTVVAPVAATPAPAPVAAAPAAATPAAPAESAPVAPAPQAPAPAAPPAAPSRPTGPPRRSDAPSGPGGPPPRREYQPRADFTPRPPRADYPGAQPRSDFPGAQPRSNFERPRGDYQQRGPGGPPRPDQRGPGGPPRGDYQQRGPGGPPRGDFQSRGPGGPPRGDYQSRGPGGPPRGDYQSRGPGGPPRGDQRGPGGPPRGDYQSRGPGGPRQGQGPARPSSIQTFAETGLEPSLENKSIVRRDRSRVKPKPTPGAVAERESEGAKAKRRAEEENRRRIRPTQVFQGDLMTDRRGVAKGRKKGQGRRPGGPMEEAPRIAKLVGDFTVGEFAESVGIPVNLVIGKLFAIGQLLSINQLLDPDKAEELAIEFGVEVVIERESDEADVAEFVDDDFTEDEPRAPVVTIMGHVDHGKTSLLDRIRTANVAEGERGGITQHIGAYKVTTPKGDVVFLDTPGHEAFTEMRSRGANVTDLVVLVVAANDGVMPQTVEAINHAKAAGVPILVAINKIDVAGASPTRVKQELMKYELLAEEYGGETICIEVSAHTGEGIDELLEYIALQTEILELRSSPTGRLQGTVVESHVDPSRGAVATVLVERGTLRVGDILVAGTEWGRVRAMRDDKGDEMEAAGPSTPVEVLGLRGSPTAGEIVNVVPSESDARDITERRELRRRTRATIHKAHISLDNLAEHMRDDEVITLNVLLKGDVQGSVEAIAQSLYKIKSNRVAIRILHSAVGAVSSSDVNLADASDAIILAFSVGVEPGARSMAEEMGVDIRKYDIIYALIEDVEKAMIGLLAPEFDEKNEGRAKVQQVFHISKVGSVAGCLVEEGTIHSDHQARLLRNGAVVWKGKLASLRRVKDEAKTVQSGVECGIGLTNFNDIKQGDSIETYTLVPRTVSLVMEAKKKPKSDEDNK